METNHKKIKLVTHNGSFHADDIFACATLMMMFENEGKEYEIIRTRDVEIINEGDYVFDVGGIYDKEKNRFDHHQVGGAGKHESGIEYASFGLVWEKFGERVALSSQVASIIEKRLSAPVDAQDNGFDLVENKYDVSPYMIQHFFGAMRPTWMEDVGETDIKFLNCVDIAKVILSREIIQARDSVMAEEDLMQIYNNTKDKRIIVVDKPYPFEYFLFNLPEPLFVVYPRTADNSWGVKAVRQDPKTFMNRKDFPTGWAGMKDGELQNITGVADAIFCHRGLFMAVAKSQEGAIKLAQIALQL